MNRIQVIALVGSIVIAIVALIVFSQFRAGQNETFVEALVVWGTDDEKFFKKVFDAYDDETKTQIRYEQKNAGTFEIDLTKALAEGKGPDVVIVDSTTLDALENVLAHVPASSFRPEDFKNTFIEIASQAFVKNKPNETYITAFPLWVDPLVLYWNRDILGASGYAAPPDNWTSLKEVSNSVKNIGQGGTVNRAGVALGRARTIPLFKEIISLLLLQQRADIENENGRFIFGPDENHQSDSTLRFYTDFGNQGNNSVYTWNNSLKSPRELFVEGKLALMLDYASYIPLLREENPHISASIAAAPQLEGAEIPIHIASVEGVAVSHMSKYKNAAWSFAYWLAGKEQARLFLEGHIVAPARRDLIDDTLFSQNPFYTVLSKTALGARRARDTNPALNSSTIAEMIESVADGRRTVSEALIYAVGRRQ